jgi:competence protein ComEC
MERLAGWVEAERGRFFLLLPVTMGSAILVYFSLAVEPPLWLGAAMVGGCGAALAAGWRFPVARFVAALALAAALGFARAEWRTADQPPLIDIPREAAEISGSIASVDILADGRRITVQNPSLDGGPKLARGIRVKLRGDDATALAPGDAVELRAMLFKPDRPAYPGAWDSGRDDFFDGIGASGFALGDVRVMQTAAPSHFGILLRGLREAIAARILAVLPISTGAIAVTLLTGFQSQIPPQEHANFIAAGLAHLLAVAGLHVGIVMGLFFGASRYLLTRHERVALNLPVKPIAASIALAAGGAYAALTGAHLPIIRSLAMASLVTLGVIAGRRAVSLRGLAMAAMFIMLTTPEAVVGVSFQMSFSAVAALIAGYDAVSNWFARLHEGTAAAKRTAAHLSGLFYTSLLAGAASMPFAAYQFQQIQPYWIFANLVAVPLTALWVMPWGLAALALMKLHLEFLALAPMGWGLQIIVWCTAVIAAWPDAMLRVRPMPDAAILLFAAGLAWLCIWRSRPRLAGLVLWVLAIIPCAMARPPDALVSPDARLIALAAPPQFLLLRRPRASAFTLAQWRPVWAGAAFTGSLCADAFCTIATPHGAVLVALSAPDDCPPAVLVLSPVPLRGACDAPGVTVIDRFTVWRDGAVAAWLTPGGARLRTDREEQGDRPWVPPWPALRDGRNKT